MSFEPTDICQKNMRELDRLISSYGSSQREILDSYYKEKVNKEASDADLKKHRDRCRKAFKRNPESTIPYKDFINGKLGQPSAVRKPEVSLQDANTAAAWELWIEFQSRIATAILPDGHGRDDAALTSLAAIFERWRVICKSYGRQCADFFKLSKAFLDEKVRPFTSKWHAELPLSEENHNRFRSELNELRGVISAFCKELEVEFSLV